MRRRWIARAARWGLTGLTAAVIGAWVMSRWWNIQLQHGGDRYVSLHSGAVWFGTVPPRRGERVRLKPGLYATKLDSGTHTGMVWSVQRFNVMGYPLVAIPTWPAAVVLLSTAALVMKNPVRAALRRRRGACLACGYDRRGLAPQAPCPECGTVPADG